MVPVIRVAAVVWKDCVLMEGTLGGTEHLGALEGRTGVHLEIIKG